jgi:quercetin dioxygenase-like cupin family protein
MGKQSEIFNKVEELNKTGLGSCNVLYIKPGAKIPKHYHKKGIEIEYVYKGNCKTHKEGRIYVWEKNKPHELINDSNEELILICLKIPPHSEEDMNYV